MTASKTSTAPTGAPAASGYRSLSMPVRYLINAVLVVVFLVVGELMIDGGVVTNSEEGAFESYAGPVTGEEVVRTVFALELYCANKDTGNNIVNYQKLTFTGCRGKSVVEWDIKEGEFFAPKYTIESMPAVGESPMTMEVVDALPVVPESP